MAEPSVTAKLAPAPDPDVQETTFAADAGPDSPAQSLIVDRAALAEETEQARASARSFNGYGSFLSNDQRDSSSSAPPPKPPARKSVVRAIAPDLLRGLMVVLMALDHNVLALEAWPHGTSIVNEADGAVVRRWNHPVAYVVRSLTHLCAPGFTLLLGMGVVYFGRSRQSLGWSDGRMMRHFVVRATVLTAITVVLGLLLTGGKVWFFNIVLFALAVDYLLAGLLWLVMARTEKSLAFLLVKVLPDAEKDDPNEPLLQDRRGEEDIAPDRKIIRAGDISWHMHNAVLVVLALVTIWWNIWVSPNYGHCAVDSPDSAPIGATSLPQSIWFGIWFYPVFGERVMSGFPPLAWLSFAIVGLLYGRVMLARSWSRGAISLGHTLAGLAFLLVFVLTRTLQFGNLSEGCLRTPDQAAHPDWNPYLVSVASFFYVVKYPPDVAFWAYTLGVNFVLLAFFGALPTGVSTRLKPLLVFGRSALFFYIAHLFVLFTTGALLKDFIGHDTDGDNTMHPERPAHGVDELWAFFGHWLFVLAILYPCCIWYGNFKSRKGPDSIWRFF